MEAKEDPPKQKLSSCILQSRVYNIMSEKIKYEYAFRTLYLKEIGTKVARDLNINYYTAKNMLRLYKQTGKFHKDSVKKINLENEEENQKFEQLCRLKISFDEKGELRALFDHKMSHGEQGNLWKLHYQLNNGDNFILWK